MTTANARLPRVRYASRARPGPPENATKKTPRPTRIQGARKPAISMRARILPVRRTLPLLQLVPHPVERIADQAGDVHLRYAHAVGDLGLRQPLEETHVEDRALTARQVRDSARERQSLLRLLEGQIVTAERLHRRSALAVEVGGFRERQRRVSRRGLERLEHVLDGRPARVRELVDAGRAAELGRELVDDLRQPDVELLDLT